MFEEIRRPTLVVDTGKVRQNALRMKGKADRNGAAFRPHLKTHQSRIIGRLFRDLGVRTGTVSSVEMAKLFADDGWDDLTIAFPANLREIGEMDELAARIRLGLLADNPDTVRALAAGLSHPVDLWIKIDTGSRRCGIEAGDEEGLRAVSEAVRRSPRLRLAGVLSHDSRTYGVRGREAVAALYREGRDALLSAKGFLASEGWQGLRASFGDTPSMSLVEDWSGLDEVRPGNFAYYDLQQWVAGSCTAEDIAAAVACPVVGMYPRRGEAVVYGGAVHLSKQSQVMPEGGTSYGAVFEVRDGRWTGFREGAEVRTVTQEHGIVRMGPEDLDSTRIGDLLFLCPVHSCLAADLLRPNTQYL
jgi:D-serine deaminase-like pyridoxal phosphate-dependent protein